MATDFANILFESDTDTKFRAWGSRISQALAQCGLVKTADTGQIDFTSVVRPAIPNTAGLQDEFIFGYEVWRFSDALQATVPVFIKVEYGAARQNNSSFPDKASYTAPVIFVTIGTATNGAGTISGNLTSSRHRVVGGTPYTVGGGGNSGTPLPTPSATQPCYFSGDGSSIQWCLGAQAIRHPVWQVTNNQNHHAGTPSMLGIERTRNALGTATADGVYYVVNHWSSYGISGRGAQQSNHQIVSFLPGYTVSANTGYWPIAYSGSGFGNANFQGDVYFTPMSVMTPKPAAPALGWLGTWKNDVPLGSTQTVNINGTPHTYVSLAGIAGAADADNLSSQIWSAIPNSAVMMRYE